MNDKIIIRNYVPKDIHRIAEIERLCFSQPWSENALLQFCENPFGRILTVEKDGVVAGYITYCEIFEEIQIANVAVAPDFRRMGMGEMLILNLIKDGELKNAEIITLEVRQSNHPAQFLYEKCGFKVEGKRKNFYSNPKEDAVLMNYTYPSRKE